MRNSGRAFLGALLGISLSALPAEGQEVSLSAELRYQQFLELAGLSDRSVLSYRTLAESLIHPAPDEVALVSGELLPTRAYLSFNSDIPFGGNDGLLWQGRGLNTKLSGGAQIRSRFGLSLVVAPEFAGSENRPFELMKSAYPSPFGYIWGIASKAGADAPQRFGDQSFGEFGWGDSEVRWDIGNFTVGFGTQIPWVGPAKINSIFHSNNAPPYPKIDLGLRKQHLAWGDLDLGTLEFRTWAGYLSESGYFDNIVTNDHNLIDALSVAYEVPYTGGLTLSFSKSYLARWAESPWASFPALFNLKFLGTGADDSWDQRTVVGFDYFVPLGGLEVYGEAGVNDYPGPNLDADLRNFQHTVVYTGGLRKIIPVDGPKSLWGEILFEWSNLEMSPAYSQFLWANTFYMHHLVTQGYTNRGQWLGAEIGTGGNSQYLSFRLYGRDGFLGAFVHRYNPDNDFITRFTTPKAPVTTEYNNEDYKAVLAIGLGGYAIIDAHWRATLGLVESLILNPTYDGTWIKSSSLVNYRFETSLVWAP